MEAVLFFVQNVDEQLTRTVLTAQVGWLDLRVVGPGHPLSPLVPSLSRFLLFFTFPFSQWL